MPTQLKSSHFFSPGTIPLRIIRMDIQDDVAPHLHEFSELVIITGGQGLHVTGGSEYPIQAGDVFAIAGTTRHAYRNTRNLSLINILHDPAGLQIPEHDLHALPGHHVLFMLEPRYRNRHKFQSRLHLPPGELAQANTLVKYMEKELGERRSGYQYLATAGFMNLIGYLCRCYSGTRQPEARSLLRLGAVISHLEQHFHEPVAITTLVNLAGMSESSLRRAFRETTGYSPIDYLIRLRIARAACLLKTSDSRISEIAWQTGFDDSNYFTRQFRSITGLSPRTYRKSLPHNA